MDGKQFQTGPTAQDTLEGLLARLPDELRVRWENEVEDMDYDEATKVIEKVLADREKVKEKSFTKINETESVETKQEIREVIKTVDQTYGDNNFFLGFGEVGRVYAMPYSGKVCVKYLVNPKAMAEHGNTFNQEAIYLEDMQGLSVSNIKVPNYYFFHIAESGPCYGMERIDGHTLAEIMVDPNAMDYIDVIRNQKKDEVKARMKEFIMKMHKERKIIHKDIFPRNIMLDRKGNWYLIDFGKAKPIEIGVDSESKESTDIIRLDQALEAFFSRLEESKFDRK